MINVGGQGLTQISKDKKIILDFEPKEPWIIIYWKTWVKNDTCQQKQKELVKHWIY